MAVHSSASVLSVNSVPKLSSYLAETRVRVWDQSNKWPVHLRLTGISSGRCRLQRVYAGLSEIEPDLNEDPVDRWEINSISSVRISLCNTFMYLFIYLFWWTLLMVIDIAGGRRILNMGSMMAIIHSMKERRKKVSVLGVFSDQELAVGFFYEMEDKSLCLKLGV